MNKIAKGVIGILAALPLGVAGLYGPAARAAPGDLDPGFGDIGRFVPAAGIGAAFSIEPRNDAELILAGGGYRRDFENVRHIYSTGFVQQLNREGALDSAFTTWSSGAPYDPGVLVRDTTLQPDGKLIAVGSAGQYPSNGGLAVLRFDEAGALDPSFGGGGRRTYGGDLASSVALDSDGRIVVAGVDGSDLVVLRLMQNGELDATFADSGIFTGAALAGVRPRILPVDTGGYRVLVQDAAATFAKCRVLALTAAGAVDESFGVLGYADLASTTLVSNCNSIVRSSAGRLLVAGSKDDHAFVLRLMADGKVDTAFDAGSIAVTMTSASAVAGGADEGVVVVGRGPTDVAGVPVVKLHADGSLDRQFGNGGTTWIDLPAGGIASAQDLAVLPGGDIVVAGGASIGWYGKPFAARLLGSDLVDGPGVLGVMRPRFSLAQDIAQVSMIVRRMGGKTGAVSVSYSTQAPADAEFPATEGEDYTAVSGRLDWADGDADDKEIVIPIGPDLPSPEERDVFGFVLSDVQGGAGLGTDKATIEIQPDGAPAGQFSITRWSSDALESDGYVQMEVTRNYYWSGAVSVSLNPVSGSATAGQDFPTAPVTVSWPDGETGTIYVNVPITDDDEIEEDETFTIELSNATGGAIVGPRSSMTITIKNDDPSSTPDPPPGTDPPPGSDPPADPSGGGGRLGWLTLLLLFLMRYACTNRVARATT